MTLQSYAKTINPPHEKGEKIFRQFQKGSYISFDTFFIWAPPIEIFYNLNKIIKIII